VAVEGCGFAVDDKVRIAFGDDAVLMALHRANALVALSGDGAIHHFAYVTTSYDLAAMTRRIADADNASHVDCPYSVKP
jgi:hypothetical protein